MKIIFKKRAIAYYNKELGRIDFFSFGDIVKFAKIINNTRKIRKTSATFVTPSEIYIYSVLHKVYDNVIKRFEQLEKTDLKNLFNDILNNYSKKDIINLHNTLSHEFEIEANDYSLLFLKILNENPAFRKLSDLISDRELKDKTVYNDIFYNLDKKLKNLKTEYFKDKSLTEFIREPFVKYPNDISRQISFIIRNWETLLDKDVYNLLLKALDFYKEDTKFGLPGPGPADVYSFNDLEPEKFTQDKDWMPHLVLIAKSTYVWLYQLSKKYKREIKYLNQIPDEELNLLKERGFTGLWLIGIWERSKASKKIKHLTGQTDAIASAYSLDDYTIAADLGGEEAFNDLKKRASKYNIRLACDMVPNHTGIDSEWIVQHPDYFMQLDYPPYPAYTFNGVNLSEKPEIEVYLEDHYYDKTDAAVVFKLIDKNKKTRYIYHGNDGTSFPWNDTAQLDYTKEFIRNAVIDKILEVAKKFPIIRFDAAMTLAKKHFQRLWFPQPGTGGAIPSRAQFGLSKEEFDKLMPKEFWREVVDRINSELPDTLLLAEAFWMMEGYFVRTLGMHRVYNSAFMNMLKNEENAKYRKSIFNILEFNPQILKRFVNFMSNPDEETAINQFGDNDKYFGVCILMSTMPGLPMFAHGQIEGFRERYGMEYYKPRWNESENSHLIQRHNREIFPLLKLRRLFSEVDNFYLYNFNTEQGYINEDVFAYSNEYNGNVTFVIYHNKYTETSGRVRFADYPTKQDNKTVWQKINIARNFHLTNDKNYYLIFKDLITGLEYIRNSAEVWEYGLYFNLRAYQYMVFAYIREVSENENGEYGKIARYLQGGGVFDIEHLKNKIKYLSTINAFNNLFSKYNIETIAKLTEISTGEYKLFLNEYLKPAIIALEKEFKKENNFYKIILPDLEEFIIKIKNLKPILKNDLKKIKKILIILTLLKPFDYNKLGKRFLWEELKLSEFGLDSDILNLIKGLHKLINGNIENNSELIKFIFEDKNLKDFLKVNFFDNHYWFNKENFELLFDVLYCYYQINAHTKYNFEKILSLYEKSDFQADKFIDLVKEK